MEQSKVNQWQLEERRHSFNKVMLWTLNSSSLHFDVLNEDKHKIQSYIKDKEANLNDLDRWNRTPLFHAALKNLPDIVDLFLKADAKLDIKDYSGRTVLHYCAEKGFYGCLKVIMQAIEKQKLFFEENLENDLAHDNNGITPLHLAAIVPSSKCIQLIMKHNFELFTGSCNSVDVFKQTPLHWAAAHGREESVALLLKHCPNSALSDCFGKSAIHYSALSLINSSKACLQLLVNAKNINNKDSDGATPLHFAVISQMNEKVIFFLGKWRKHCVDINAGDNYGRTALHFACAKKAMETIIKLLLSSGAEVNKKDVYGNTALHYAVLHNNKKVTKIIVENSYSLDCCNKKGESAMHWSAAVGANASLLTMYQQAGSVEKYDGNGVTPIHIAAMNNHTSSVEMLLKLKVSIDLPTTDGSTPLHYAAYGDSMNVVKYLLGANAAVYALDKNGRNALHYSVISRHLHLSQLLIESGVSIDCKDKFGQTALHFAAFFGYRDLLCLLLENRANVNATNNQGKVALHVACEQGNYDAAKCLLEFFAFPNYLDNTNRRATPLDYCLWSKRDDIAALLVDSGGVQSNMVLNFAAILIHACWKGYCTRKKFADSCAHGQPRNLLIDNSLDIALVNFQLASKQITDNSTYLMAVANHISEGFDTDFNSQKEAEDAEENSISEGGSCEDESYDEIDLNALPQFPISIIEKEDGSTVRELEFGDIIITLPSDERLEQNRKAMSELKIVEISCSDNDEC